MAGTRRDFCEASCFSCCGNNFLVSFIMHFTILCLVTSSVSPPRLNHFSSSLFDTPGSWAFDSYSGSVGHAGKWQPYAKRKMRASDVVGCLLDLKRGQMTFFLEHNKDYGDAFPDFPASVAPDTVVYASLTLKYKGTTVCGRFAPPFVHQSLVDAYLRKHHSNITPVPKCLPLIATHPRLAALERTQASAHLRFNLAQSPLYQLPDEVLLEVFAFFTPQELARSMRTCRLFHCLTTENRLWSDLLNSEFGRQTSAVTQDVAAAEARSKFGSKSRVIPSTEVADGKDDEEMLSMYAPTESSLYARFRVLHNWSEGRVDSKRNFWCNTDVHCVHFDSRYIACGTDEEILLFDTVRKTAANKKKRTLLFK